MSEQQRRRLTAEDLYQFVTISDPQLTPDGETIAFVKSWVDAESKEPRSALWLVPAAGGSAVQFTRGQRSDSSPRWSPDGRTLAFVSDRGGDRQLWLIDRFGGEARQLTTMRHGATHPVWSPDGRRIAFVAAVGPDEGRESLTQAKTDAEKKAEEKRAKDEARTFTTMMWRADATGIKPDRKAQIWTVAVPAAGEPAPTPVQVTWGPYDHSAPQWSPCGRFLAFTARRTEEEHLRFNDVFITALPGPDTPGDGSDFAPRNLTEGKGQFAGGYFSPDGQTIAVLGHQNEFQNATQAKIYLFPVAGGEPRELDNWDLSIGNTVGADVRTGATGVEVTWAPDSNFLYLPVTERGACSVYQFPVVGGRPQLLVGGEREIFGGTFDANCERLAFVAGDHQTISDLYVIDCREFVEERLTQVNQGLFDQIEWPQIEELTFTARDGWELHGWLVKPVGFAEGQRYPLVLDIHGGPHTCYGYTFFQEFQLLAAHGYGVLFINPRGSTGYGQEFVNAVRGDYGGKDYCDLMDAVDHALTRGWVDPERLAVTGGSYGGFMTNWIVTQTDRFAAAITHRSISNWVSFAGTPDFGPFFNQMQHLVEDPWSPEGVQALWRISPLAYAAKVRTPISIMHSEFDFRCPIEQAEQFYMAIKFYKQAPVELVRHPRSNHDLTRLGPPALRVDRFHKILRWFDQYCKSRAPVAR